MALLDTPKSKAIAAIVLAGLIAYMGWSGDGIQTVGMQGLRAKQDEVKAKEDTLARLTAETDSVKRILARGSVEELNRRIDEYTAVLETLRQLVPDRNEVPTLLDAISGQRGKRRELRGV
jgi:Tfp pilus assembly protein PilN